MAKYQWTAESEVLDAAPAQLTNHITADGQLLSDWKIVSAAGATGGQALKLVSATGVRRILTLPGVTETGRVDIRGRFYASSDVNSGLHFACAHVGGGASAAEATNLMSRIGNGRAPGIGNYNPTFTAGAIGTALPSSGHIGWWRFRYTVDNDATDPTKKQRLAIWDDDGAGSDEEPDGTVFVNNVYATTITGGAVGFGAPGSIAPSNDLFDWITVGTGGDDADLEPSAGSPPAGTVTIGTITPTSEGASVAFTYDDTDQTGFHYRLNGGTPASAGTASPLVLSGLTAATTYDLEIRAVNAGGNGAWSSVAQFTTDAAPSNPAPTFGGPDIGGALTGIEGVALADLDVSGRFSDTDALTFSAVGGWPAGVTVSSAGVIGGTPSVVGMYPDLKVRATDTASQEVDSNTFTFDVLEAPVAGTITLLAMKNPPTSPLVGKDVNVSIANAASGAHVLTLTEQVTGADGVLTITNSAIEVGIAYAVTTIDPDATEGGACGCRIYIAT